MTPRPRSYFWALRVHGFYDLNGLSPFAQQGLEYAEQLAENAAMRAAVPPHKQEPALTPQEIGDVGVSGATVRRLIAQARTELFGSLSDSGIRHRLKADALRRRNAHRLCVVCDHPLPFEARRSRSTCSDACRKRKSRA